MSETTPYAVRLQDVTKQYQSKKGTINALDSVSLDVPQGAILGVVGTSGAGKSTLLRTINRLEEPTSGAVTVLEHDVSTLSATALRALRRDVSMVFQHFNLLSTQTVAQNVAMPLVLAKVPKVEIQQRVAQVLELVGLADRADHLPKQLSGGQRQRVGIARALVTNPKILLCDEPTSALDPITTNQILDLLIKANEELGVTVILITHEISVVSRIADTVAVMQDGRIIEHGSVETVFAAPQQPLTRRFVETVVPQSLPLATQAEVESGQYHTILRVVHRGGAARGVISHLTAQGVQTALLHASDAALRTSTVGTMVLGLNNTTSSSSTLSAALDWLAHKDGLQVEVLV